MAVQPQDTKNKENKMEKLMNRLNDAIETTLIDAGIDATTCGSQDQYDDLVDNLTLAAYYQVTGEAR